MVFDVFLSEGPFVMHLPVFCWEAKELLDEIRTGLQIDVIEGLHSTWIILK
jgi:hypothetical protein